jgi:hypothetical protein
VDLKRLARHLFFPKRAFSARAMVAIEQAIAHGESQHGGEVRFAAEPALDTAALLAGQSARERALEVFSLLRLWDTAERNGVLIYLLLADRDIEIVADRGLNMVKASEWESICRRIEEALRRGEFQQGVVEGIHAVSRVLANHFPRRAGDRNELPDRPVTI